VASNNEKRTAEIIINGQKAEASLKDMSAAAAVLNNQVSKLTPGTEEFVKKSQQLQQVRKRYKEVRAEVNGVDISTKKAKAGFLGITSATDLMKKGFDLALKSLLPLFAVQKLLEVAQHVLGIESAYTKLSGTIAKVTGLQDEALQKATIQVKAITDTFDISTDELLKSANAMAKEFGISVPEALEKIGKGLTAAADKDEFLAQAAEYSTHFSKAGVEAEGFVAQLIRAEREGIFSDKGADVIKEFENRIKEQTTASKTALEDAFGKEFTNEIFSNLNNGSITSVQALERVAEKMNDTTVPANKLQTVIADVFGGPGEDAGLRYIQSLTSIGGSIDDLIDKNDPLNAQLAAQLALNEELATVQAELGAELQGSSGLWESITTNLQILGSKVLVEVVKAFKSTKDSVVDVYNNSLPLRAVFQSIVFVFESLYNISSTFFKNALDGFTGLSSTVGALLAGDFSSIPEIISNTFKNFDKNLADLGKTTITNFKEAVDNTLKENPIDTEAAKIVTKETIEEQKKSARHQAQEVARVSKEEAEKIRKANEKTKQAELALVQSIEDLKIQAIEDSNERQIAQINKDTERKLAALKGTDKQIEEQTLALEQIRFEKLKALKDQQEEQTRQEELEKFQLREEEKALLEEQEKIALEEKYLDGIIKEEEYQEAIFNMQQQALESKLTLLKQTNTEEGAEAQKLKNEILKIENEKTKSIIAFEKKKRDAKKLIDEAELADLQNSVQQSLGFIAQLRDEEGKQSKASKLAAKANIIISGKQEVANIWKNASELSLFGTIAGAIQTALAIARTVKAVREVDSVNTSFAFGGYTGSGTIKDVTGHKVAGVVHDGEWVAPKWMNQDPVYANVIGMLETARKQGFATGGFTEPASITQPSQNIPQQANTNIEELKKIQEIQLQETIALRQTLENWPKELKVINNVGDTEEGIKVLNSLRKDGSIN